MAVLDGPGGYDHSRRNGRGNQYDCCQSKAAQKIPFLAVHATPVDEGLTSAWP